MLEIEIAACSDRGGRASNEDALGAGRCGANWFAVLSDGAGGHARGAEAARRVVEQIETALQLSASNFVPAALTETLLGAHSQLQSEQPGAEGRERMHATVVVLWIDGDGERALWAHVGDSRLYRIRHGRVEQLTADDSMVERLRASGALTAEQAADHPLKYQLLAALGMRETIAPEPLDQPVLVHDGDVFLLCSDGWWGLLDHADLTDALFDATTPDAWLQAMRSLISARCNSRHDNFSAIAVWASDPTETTQVSGDAQTALRNPHHA